MDPARVVTLHEFTQLERPHLDFVVDPFIPRTGLVVLGGAPFAGKSYLALQLAFAVAQGRSMFGAPCKQGPVLYFQFDVGELVFRRVIETIAQKGGDTSGPVFTLHPGTEFSIRDLGERAFYDQLASAIAQVDPVLVIFDVLREIHNRRENSSDAMKVLFELLEKLVEGRGCLILHHSKKPDKDTPDSTLSDRLRGSSYIAGRVDTLWILDHGELMMESRLHEPICVSGTRELSGFWRFDEFPVQQPLAAHDPHASPRSPAPPAAPAGPRGVEGSTPRPVHVLQPSPRPAETPAPLPPSQSSPSTSTPLHAEASTCPEV